MSNSFGAVNDSNRKQRKQVSCNENYEYMLNGNGKIMINRQVVKLFFQEYVQNFWGSQNGLDTN